MTEPEQKRKVIGELFIRIFEDEQKKCGAKYLVQGTIAPDWIESGGGVRDTIKSHHNVGGLPDDMTLSVVEPLRELYKDEVRELARTLEINVAERQPFPGPGLAVRTLGELTPERVAVVREKPVPLSKKNLKPLPNVVKWTCHGSILQRCCPFAVLAFTVMFAPTVRPWLCERFSPWTVCQHAIPKYPTTSSRKSAHVSRTPSKAPLIAWCTTSRTNRPEPLSGSERSGGNTFIDEMTRQRHGAR